MSRVRWLLVLSLLGACSDPPPPPTTVVHAPPPASAPEPLPEQPTWLYRVTTATQPSYVFAALEYGCPLHEALPHDYAALFQFARVVIVSDARTEEEMTDALRTQALDRSGSLAGTLGPERMAELTAEIDDAVPPAVVRFLRPPWALSLFFAGIQSDAYGARLSDGRMSPTHDAVSRRRMSGAALSGLYDAHDIDRILASGSAMAPDALRAAIDHIDQTREISRTTLAAYRAGDQDALVAAIASDTPGVEAWSAAVRATELRALDTHFDALRQDLQAGNAFAVLQAADVLGERGVLARLRANGVEITRISVPAPAP